MRERSRPRAQLRVQGGRRARVQVVEEGLILVTGGVLTDDLSDGSGSGGRVHVKADGAGGWPRVSCGGAHAGGESAISGVAGGGGGGSGACRCGTGR